MQMDMKTRAKSEFGFLSLIVLFLWYRGVKLCRKLMHCHVSGKGGAGAKAGAQAPGREEAEAETEKRARREAEAEKENEAGVENGTAAALAARTAPGATKHARAPCKLEHELHSQQL